MTIICYTGIFKKVWEITNGILQIFLMKSGIIARLRAEPNIPVHIDGQDLNVYFTNFMGIYYMDIDLAKPKKPCSH